MKDLNEFRVINKTEKQYIQKTLSSKIIENLRNLGYLIYISINNLNSEKGFPSLYLISRKLTDLIDSVSSMNIISSAGLYFGFIKRGLFYLSIEGAEFIFNQNLFSKDKYLYVSKKGEKSVLYGNKIKKHMITKIPPNLEKQNLLLVFNDSNELISLARSQIFNRDYQDLKSNDVVAMNLIDKGYYLRKKQ